MLKHLSINNYAIISELEIDFSQGMNIITGETGAGKSIIIGALNLILGERADSSVLVNKEKKCIIEGIFEADGHAMIEKFLADNDLDHQSRLIVRREIATSGKSRAFINDTPVNLSQLSELSTMLVDLHQQFDTLSLGDKNFQVNVTDALAQTQPLLISYQSFYKEWQQNLKQLQELQQQQQQFEKESDYNRFQFEELSALQLKENELEEIEEEIKLLSHSEEIKNVLNRVCSELSDNDQPITSQLKSLVNLLDGFTAIHKELPGLSDRLRSAQIELSDIASELEHINDRIHFDPQKTEELNERLSVGYKLQKKHGVQSTRELLDIQQELEDKLQAVWEIADEIAALEKQTAAGHEKVLELAEKISNERKKHLPAFEKKVNQLLTQVGMPNAALKVSLHPQLPDISGIDAIDFLLDANKSGQFKPVGKVASGGELSRLMLCIKSLVAEKMDMPTLIFDEIDTGISGEAAKQAGIIMKTLSASRQIICITHQPQIAGRADAHFFVYKELQENKVATQVRQLNTDERIIAIAQMLSGEKPTAAALENAREMIQN